MEGSGFEDSNTRIIIKGTSNYGLVKGQIAKAAFDFTRAHMFDKVTENSINPRVPSMNLVDAEINGNVLSFGGLEFELPQAISLENGEYEVTIPTRAITLGTEGVKVEVAGVEKVNNVNLISLTIGENLLFTSTEEEIDPLNDCITLDFTQLEFVKDGKVVKPAIAEYDRINAIFLNNETAKSYIGDKYVPVIEQRVNDVTNKYEPLLAEMENDYNTKCAEELAKVSPERTAANKAELATRKMEVNALIADLNAQFKQRVTELKVEHAQNNERITAEVNAMYNKIRDEEFRTFEEFKAINKDRDAYRKRSQELQNFKATFGIEKNNELDKRINLEAIRYESEVNAIKGNVKREKELLTKELEALAKKCAYEANPVPTLTKEYKKAVKKVKAEYEEAYTHANILFFFKVNDLVVLSSDAISNKMIQGLGIKVFTKQYLIELPHNCFTVSDEGMELNVLELLDYGRIKYLHCQFDDGQGQKDIYVETELTEAPSTIKVLFDITKCHITEKGMDIKIY